MYNNFNTSILYVLYNNKVYRNKFFIGNGQLIQRLKYSLWISEDFKLSCTYIFYTLKFSMHLENNYLFSHI